MASNLVNFHFYNFNTANLSTSFLQHKNLTFFPSNNNLPYSNLKYPRLSIVSSLSSSSFSTTPPSSKEEAVLQAKLCLSKTLEKPLNNPKLVGKLKKLKQPKFQVEIPVIDDSPKSLSQLVFDIFSDLPIKRKGSTVKILILWPNPSLKTTAIEIFQSNSSKNVENVEISSIINGDYRVLGSFEVAVFLAPEISQLAAVKAITDNLYPKPVVIFNPKWGFGEETAFGNMGGFVESFDVIYSFVGLEVRGILSKRKGVVFKCVRDGAVSGERWMVLVEEENGEMKVISKFKTRPSIGEVENVLYNMMAINSPLTKSAKFLKDLVSNVTAKKVE